LKFVDLFAGLGGFHRALTTLGHECVFASELDEELRQLYVKNYNVSDKIVHGDVRISKSLVPAHDILCAGFPCQPFSKSGSQNGQRDRTRGTLFHEILEILAKHHPRYVILENVGNFERHNNGRTWAIVRDSLQALGYQVRGTTHITSGGHGLISPHHFGFPHTRERFFIVASMSPLPADPFPRGNRHGDSHLSEIVQRKSELDARDRRETALSEQQVACIDHWNALLKRLPEEVDLPSFPIWGDELGARYPYETITPAHTSTRELQRLLRTNGHPLLETRAVLIEKLPRYAQSEDRVFPDWKIGFIRQNREWFRSIEKHLSKRWIAELRTMPPSLRKLEWNCKGEERDLWAHVLQFRPSGLRAKRYSSVPALVAMTVTQIPILGPKRRFLSRIEGCRLQGLPDTHRLPEAHSKAFGALGNAVHAGVVRAIAQRLLPK
jgi:DNA (cytosine-5)-methyltransferase 1